MPRIYPVARGLLTGIFLTVFLGVIVGLLVHLTTLPELGSTFGIGLLGLVVFLGGLLAAHREGKKGLLVGLEVSLAVILLLLIITLIFYPGQFTWKVALIKTVIALVAGALGGSVGVALKTR